MPGSSLSRHLESGVDPGNEVGDITTIRERSRRFCHHGRQIAEEVWIDNGDFGAKF